jgi:hypothetical protein
MSMSHATITLFDLVKGLATLLVGVLTVLYASLVRRMDRLEEEQKTKADLADLAEVKEMIRENRRESQANFQTVQGTLSQILMRMGGEK